MDIARHVGAGHDLIAQRVDGPAGEDGVGAGQVATRLAQRNDLRELRPVHPDRIQSSTFHRPPECTAPMDAVTPVSTAGTPDRAWVATAWHGQ